MAQHKRRRGRHAHSQGNITNTKKRNRRGHRGQGGQHARSLGFEPLEDRRMLALFVVNDLGDFDEDDNLIAGSLRNAVLQANASGGFDTIIFSDFLFNGPGSGVIALDPREEGGPLLLTDPDGIQILGPGAGVLSVFAPGSNRIFLVDDADADNLSSVTISGLTLSGGSPAGDDEDGRGGAILNRESLTLEEVEIRNSFAPGGGGAVFNDIGSFLRIERSLIRDNTSGAGGGGIQNGILDEEENLPTTTIVNSTITGNMANGAGGGDTSYGGGGVLNLSGTVNIEQSTIFGNSTSTEGGGVVSQGFDAEFEGGDDDPVPTVLSGFATTNIRSSIIVGNMAPDIMGILAPNDVGSLGVTADLALFQPQINSQGYNLFGVLTHRPVTANPNITLPPSGPGDLAGVDPNGLFIEDQFSAPLLNDFGGVLPVFMPDINMAGGLLAIDMGDPFNVSGNYDQRGAQFVRAFDATGMVRMDIGAAEVQVGNFFVDTLVDENDGRFSNVPVSEGAFPFNFLTLVPDFSIREAIGFAEKNEFSLFGASGLPQFPGLQETNQITFSGVLTDPDLNPDPTPGTSAPTILLTLGQLTVSIQVIIQGPAFDLEIDATGNDPTPAINDGQGSRVFFVSNTVEISNLILRGGDHSEFGGAIFTTGDLVALKNITLLDNATSGSGGAIYVASGTLNVDSSTLYDNFSAGSGGGIFVAGGDVTVSNSTITGNTAASHGGGIANADGNLAIQYSTITLNTAGILSSGVASYRKYSATTSIRSSIISGNTFNDVQHVNAAFTGPDNITSLGFNLFGNVDAGTSLMGSDLPLLGMNPMLAPLARLGGPTPVHRLLAGSPAVDAGDPSAAPTLDGEPILQDQRGFPFDRIEGANPIDIGAFETQDGQLMVGDTTMGADFETFVEALDESNVTPTTEEIVFLPSWLGESFPGDLAITDSVSIFGLGGFFFGFEFLIDDGDNSSLLNVSIDNFEFRDNMRFVSKENLTFTNTRFVNNTATDTNGGAISQQFGKLTIEDSTFIGNTVSGIGSSGGAIHVLNGDLEINNSFLSGNSTGVLGGKGGAIYIRDGDFTGNYLYITGNVAAAATGDGGGIYARDSTVMLTNAVISGNSTTGSDSEGGGISAKDSDITLMNPTISLNTTVASQSRGGGIFVDGGSLDIQDGNFFGNKTYGQYSSGGGISSVNADVTITGTSLLFNEVFGSDSDGGGIYAVGGNLTVRDSAVFNNRVNDSNSNGGGIYSSGDLSGSQTTSIINSTISGNSTSGVGGGIFNAAGLMVIKHSTITANDAPYVGDGGGVGSYGDSSTTRTEVDSSIISGNLASSATALSLAASTAADFDGDNDTDGFDFLAWQRGFGTPAPLASKSEGDADNDQDVDNFDLNSWESGFGSGGEIFSDVDRVGFPFDETFLSLGFNIIGSGLSVEVFDAVGDQSGVTNALLGDLANNGGPTRTHALLSGSPAIDAGDPAFSPTSITPSLDFDQRGVGFDRVSGGQIDIGAFEVQPPPAPLLASISTEPTTNSPLAASVSNEPSIIAASQVAESYVAESHVTESHVLEVRVEAPLLATSTSTDGETRQGIASLLTRLNSQAATTLRSVAPRFNAAALTSFFDELEVSARDNSLARFALLSERFGQLNETVDLSSLADSLHSDGSAEEFVAEDLVFELLGEELL